MHTKSFFELSKWGKTFAKRFTANARNILHYDCYNTHASKPLFEGDGVPERVILRVEGHKDLVLSNTDENSLTYQTLAFLTAADIYHLLRDYKLRSEGCAWHVTVECNENTCECVLTFTSHAMVVTRNRRKRRAVRPY